MLEVLERRGELFFLPGYTPELNPDEQVWGGGVCEKPTGPWGDHEQGRTKGAGATPIALPENAATQGRRIFPSPRMPIRGMMWSYL